MLIAIFFLQFHNYTQLYREKPVFKYATCGNCVFAKEEKKTTCVARIDTWYFYL